MVSAILHGSYHRQNVFSLLHAQDDSPRSRASIAAIAAAEITKERAIVAAVIAEQAEAAITMVAMIVGQTNENPLEGGERHYDGVI